MPRDFEQLKGKMLAFEVLNAARTIATGKKDRRPCGFRLGKVVDVDCSTRTGLRSVLVRRFDPATKKYNGARIRVFPDEIRRPCGGVLWRKKLVPLDEWLAGGAA